MGKTVIMREVPTCNWSHFHKDRPYNVIEESNGLILVKSDSGALKWVAQCRFEPYGKKPLKMYFLIRDDIDVGHAVNSMGHAGALISIRGWPCDDPIMREWWNTSFRKCTVKATREQMEKAEKYDDWFQVEEMAFDNERVIMVFKPRREWPRFFHSLPLYK